MPTVVLTLLYHNVLSVPADGLPLASHQVTVKIFRWHIHHLRKQLLHPVEVHDQLMRGKMPKGVLITFDDGTAGILEAGKILAEAGAAGIAFICPGAVTAGLWFYRLGDALVRASVSRLTWRRLDLPLREPVEKCRAYQVLSKELFDLPAGERDDYLAGIIEACQTVPGQPSPSLTILDRKGLDRAAETGGLMFANHSWSHPNLVKVSAAELRHEVEAADHWLAASGLPILPWFAFPRGSHDTHTRKIVAQFCPIAFGACAHEHTPQVLPRTSIFKMDANRIRFSLKTALEGRLRAYLSLSMS